LAVLQNQPILSADFNNKEKAPDDHAPEAVSGCADHPDAQSMAQQAVRTTVERSVCM